MRRHLPLLGAPAPEIQPPAGEAPARVPLGRGSIGIADPDSGASAVGFARELSLAFRERDVLVRLYLLGYQGVPTLERTLSDQLVAAGVVLSAHAVAADFTPLPADLPPASVGGVALWVGLPALGAYEPALSVILQTERPLSSWPALLRAARPRCRLELGARRVGLASTLVAALIGSGFLPGE